MPRGIPEANTRRLALEESLLVTSVGRARPGEPCRLTRERRGRARKEKEKWRRHPYDALPFSVWLALSSPVRLRYSVLFIIFL
jgi:hypothetical protein